MPDGIVVDKEEEEIDKMIQNLAEGRVASDDGQQDSTAKDMTVEEEEGSAVQSEEETTGADNEEIQAEELPPSDTVDEEVVASEGDPEQAEIELTDKQKKQVKAFQKKMTKATTVAAELQIKNDQLEQLLLDSVAAKKAGTDAEETDAVEDIEQEIEEDEEKLGEMEDEFSILKKEFPEITPALQNIFNALSKQMTTLKRQLNISKKVSDQNVKNSAQFMHDSKIEVQHKDFKVTVGTDAFIEYLDNLRPQMRKFADKTLKSGTALDIIELLDDFVSAGKEDPVLVQKREKKAKLDQAKDAAVPSVGKQTKKVQLGTKPTLTYEAVTKMSNDQFTDEVEAEVDKLLLSRKMK
jgi:hypothetical protein